MRPLWIALGALLVASPLAAQRRVDLLIDAQGVQRTGENTDFTPGTRYEPRFGTGRGVGGGVNWHFSDRLSLEVKVAGIGSRLRVRTVGSDFIFTSDLGWAQIYPITGVVQWHMLEEGSIRPYVGVGAAYTILRNIEEATGPVSEVQFDDPWGLVVNAGLRVPIGKRFSLYGDGRYVPIETSSRATFGSNSGVELNVRPLIVSFGLAYHY